MLHSGALLCGPSGKSVADRLKSLAYGKCIGKSYKEVSKGMCEAEFATFKECVQVSQLVRTGFRSS
jgi:hypothetical protein